MPFKYSLAKNNWQGGASLGFVKKQFGDPKTQLTNATATVWKSHVYVLHGLKTAEEKPCLVSKVPAAPSTLGSLGKAAPPPSAVPNRGLLGTTTSTASGFVFGTGFGTAPAAARTTGSGLGVGSTTTAVLTEVSLPEAESTSFTFASSNSSQV